LHESLGDRKLVLGVDRLDYSKGLPQRFDAFGRLLYAFPQHRRHVNFLQIAARSRQEVGSYQTLRRELDRRAGDINGEFSDFDWVPLRYMTHAVRRSAIAGFYRRAQIGLVLIVNPFDADEVAEAIHIGLVMSLEERQARHKALLEKVNFATAARYCEQFLGYLKNPEKR
jgi:trehalose 6-phosphate synthase